MEAWKEVTDVSRIGSYPKVYGLGHRAIAELLQGPVLVEEKVDGSQFSFGRFGGELLMRSKGQQVHSGEGGMFSAAMASAAALDLRDGWVYRGEYLMKPKHNALAYSRTPASLIALFDVQTGLETYLAYPEKAAEAERIGLECVPILYEGEVTSAEELMALLEREAFLGGCKVEGVVVKNYARFSVDGKAMMGKHVREDFKETNAKNWKTSNPRNGDILEILGAVYRTEARWHKAVQHLAEAGTLTNEPRDIGALIAEVQRDLLEEEADGIKERLWQWARGHIQRKSTAGLPEWYKGELMKRQFEGAK